MVHDRADGEHMVSPLGITVTGPMSPLGMDDDEAATDGAQCWLTHRGGLKGIQP